MLELELDIPDREVNGLLRKLDSRARRRFEEEIEDIVLQGGLDLLSQVRWQASNPPGPNVVTGEYVNSWMIDIGADGTVRVFTEHPASFRLEYGYVGVDALGRHYNQPPFPHVALAVAIVMPQFRQNIMNAVQKWGSS